MVSDTPGVTTTGVERLDLGVVESGHTRCMSVRWPGARYCTGDPSPHRGVRLCSSAADVMSPLRDWGPWSGPVLTSPNWGCHGGLALCVDVDLWTPSSARCGSGSATVEYEYGRHVGREADVLLEYSVKRSIGLAHMLLFLPLAVLVVYSTRRMRKHSLARNAVMVLFWASGTLVVASVGHSGLLTSGPLVFALANAAGVLDRPRGRLAPHPAGSGTSNGFSALLSIQNDVRWWCDRLKWELRALLVIYLYVIGLAVLLLHVPWSRVTRGIPPESSTCRPSPTAASSWSWPCSFGACSHRRSLPWALALIALLAGDTSLRLDSRRDIVS